MNNFIRNRLIFDILILIAYQSCSNASQSCMMPCFIGQMTEFDPLVVNLLSDLDADGTCCNCLDSACYMSDRAGCYAGQ